MIFAGNNPTLLAHQENLGHLGHCWSTKECASLRWAWLRRFKPNRRCWLVLSSPKTLMHIAYRVSISGMSATQDMDLWAVSLGKNKTREFQIRSHFVRFGSKSYFRVNWVCRMGHGLGPTRTSRSIQPTVLCLPHVRICNFGGNQLYFGGSEGHCYNWKFRRNIVNWVIVWVFFFFFFLTCPHAQQGERDSN